MGKRRALVYFPGLGGNGEAQGAASGVAQGLCLFSRSWWQWVSAGPYLLFLSWWQWVSAGPYLLFFVLVAMGKRRALFTLLSWWQWGSAGPYLLFCLGGNGEAQMPGSPSFFFYVILTTFSLHLILVHLYAGSRRIFARLIWK